MNAYKSKISIDIHIRQYGSEWITLRELGIEFQ